MDSNSSSAQTSNSTPITIQDVPGVAIAGNSGNVNMLDGGVIQASKDVSLAAITTAAQLTLGILDKQAVQNSQTLGFAQAAADNANKFAMDAGRSDIALYQKSLNVMMWVGGLLAAGVLFKGKLT